MLSKLSVIERFCSNCGRSSSSKFCPYCGVPMQQQVQTQLPQQQPQQEYVPKKGHAVRNLAILLVLAFIFFGLPFVNVESVNVGFASGSLTGSMSYAILHCGEVHLSGSAFGASFDRYEFVCGNNQFNFTNPRTF